MAVVRRFQIFDLVNALLLVLLCVAMVVPFLHVAAVSVSAPRYILRNQVFLSPRGFTVAVYRSVMMNRDLWTGYLNTVIYAVAGTAINLALTSTLAYALAQKRMPLRRTLVFLVAFTMMFGGGLIPTFLVVRGLGMVNTRWAMLIPGAIGTWNLLVMRSFFMTVSPGLVESATVDGCGDFRIFMSIVLPVSTAVMASIGLFYAVGHWNSFFDALVYLQNRDKYPLQLVLRSIVVQGTVNPLADNVEWEVAENIKYANVMVATVPILCVYPFIQRHFVKGVMIGSLKD